MEPWVQWNRSEPGLVAQPKEFMRRLAEQTLAVHILNGKSRNR